MTGRLLSATLLFLYIFGLIPSRIEAQIGVIGVIQEFAPDQRPFKDIFVTNESSSAMLLQAEVFKTQFPGPGDETLSTTDDLVISPKRFSIAPNGKRAVRVLLKRGFGDVEQLYRIRFVPQPPLPEETPEPTGPTGKAVSVRIVTTTGVLLFVYPKQGKTALSWERRGGKVVFRNSGNMHTLLDDIRACLGEDESNCVGSPRRRVYPGIDVEIDAEPQRRVLLRTAEGDAGEARNIEIPPS